MQWLIVVFYTVLFTILFLKWKKLANENISALFIAGVFLLKCFLAVLYIYVHYRYYGGGDLTEYHKDGNIVYQTLFENPLKYIHLLFGINGIKPVPDIIAPEVEAMGLWWDNGLYAVVRFYAFTNLFTFGSLYATGIFVALCSTVGMVLLYKSICEILPDKNTMLKVAIFGIPSTMFFTSGPHKEGLLIFFFGVFFYAVTQLYLKVQSITFFACAVMVAFFIWLIRDFTWYLLLPGFLAFVFSLFIKKHVPLVFFVTVVVSAGVALLFQFEDIENSVLYKGNFLEIIQVKQSFFQALSGGNSYIAIEKFNPDMAYLLKEIPLAFSRCFFAPFYLSSLNAYQWVFVIENVVIGLFALLLISHISFKKITWNNIALWQFIFAVSMMILIGIVVSNIGASVRYRSILLPFVFIFLISITDAEKLKTTLSKFSFV